MSDFAKISKERYFYYLENGIPYQGEVEGLGFAINTITTTSYSANKTNTAFFHKIDFINICVTDSSMMAPFNFNAGNYSKKEPGGWIQKGEYIFYDREVTSQTDAEKKHGRNAKYLPEGHKVIAQNQKGETEEYSLYNANKGTVKDRDGNIVDNTKQIRTQQFIIFGTCDTCINAGTLDHNLFWSTYIGPWNPKDYLGNDSYGYAPKKWSEYPAIRHDKEYDQLGVSGISGALFATEVMGADFRIVKGEVMVAILSPDPVDKLQAPAVAVFFTVILGFKSIIWVGEQTVDSIKKMKISAEEFWRNANNAIERAVNPLNYYPY